MEYHHAGAGFRSYCLQQHMTDVLQFIVRLERHLIDCIQRGAIGAHKYQSYTSRLQTAVAGLRSTYNELMLQAFQPVAAPPLSLVTREMLLAHDYEGLLGVGRSWRWVKGGCPHEGDRRLFSGVMPLSDGPWKKDVCDVVRDVGYSDVGDLLRFFDVPGYVWESHPLLPLAALCFAPSRAYLVSNRAEPSQTALDAIRDLQGLMTRDMYMAEIDNKDVFGGHIELNVRCDAEDRWLVVEGLLQEGAMRLYSRMIAKVQTNPIHTKKRMLSDYVEAQPEEDGREFKRELLKTASAGEIVARSVPAWYVYLEDSWRLFVRLQNMSTERILAEVLQQVEQKKMFHMIRVLMLGSHDNVHLACVIYHMLKNRKHNTFADKVFQRLCSEHQNHLIDTQMVLKKETLGVQVDWRKLVAADDRIPFYVKVLLNDKIDEMGMMNNDYHKQYTYVKTLVHFPWHEDPHALFRHAYDPETCRRTLDGIRAKLDAAAYGHAKAKEQILLQVAKWMTNPDGGGTVLALEGPPGVGKTLLAKNLAAALDMPMIHITLGGQNDASLLHGHCYTYSAAQPGMIVKKVAELGTAKCVLFLDELDKTTSKHNEVNEISSVLVHLTDLNSNKSFQDRFFDGIDFPLDKMIIVASFNDRDKVDPILLDRFIEIPVKPYTIRDKIHITQRFLLKELVGQIGFRGTLELSDDQVRYIVHEYTREPGVRDLRRRLEQIMLKMNLAMLMGELKQGKPLTLTTKEIDAYVSDKRVTQERVHSGPLVGVVNGLYATSSGCGGVIPIQVTPNHFPDGVNQFHFKLTGSQGEVMKESISCAFSAAVAYLQQSHPQQVATLADRFPRGFHVHTPSGGTPKDGPSAGCAFVLAFVSAVLGRRVPNTIAMTGEVDLQGNVTKIGGLVHKLYGAKSAGVRLVLISKENAEDVEEIVKENPDLFDQSFAFNLVENVGDVVAHGLEN
jgi:ATP-dependent Lon protease